MSWCFPSCNQSTRSSNGAMQYCRSRTKACGRRTTDNASSGRSCSSTSGIRSETPSAVVLLNCDVCSRRGMSNAVITALHCQSSSSSAPSSSLAFTNVLWLESLRRHMTQHNTTKHTRHAITAEAAIATVICSTWLLEAGGPTSPAWASQPKAVTIPSGPHVHVEHPSSQSHSSPRSFVGSSMQASDGCMDWG